jgi:hypothetical protein
MKYFYKLAANALTKRMNRGIISEEDGLRIYNNTPEYSRKPRALKEIVGSGTEGKVYKSMHPKAGGKMAVIKHYDPNSSLYSKWALLTKERIFKENSHRFFMPEFYGTHKDNKNAHYLEYVRGNKNDNNKAYKIQKKLNKKYENEFFQIMDIHNNPNNFKNGKVLDFLAVDNHAYNNFIRANARAGKFGILTTGDSKHVVGNTWKKPIKNFKAMTEEKHIIFDMPFLRNLDHIHARLYSKFFKLKNKIKF